MKEVEQLNLNNNPSAPCGLNRRGRRRGPRCCLGSEGHGSGAAEEGAEPDPAGAEDLGEVLWLSDL